MRKIFAILAIVIASQTMVFAQKYSKVTEKDVPTRFVKDFTKRYPEAKNVEWTKVDSLLYDVNFENNSSKTMLRFSNKGVETRWNVELQYTPEKIKSYVNQEYPKFKIKKVDIVDILNKKTYRVEIMKKKLFKKTEKVLNFEIDGKFIDEQGI
jgi:hypothetical protein